MTFKNICKAATLLFLPLICLAYHSRYNILLFWVFVNILLWTVYLVKNKITTDENELINTQQPQLSASKVEIRKLRDDNRKFIIQYIIIPMLIGYAGYVAQDKFIGKKEAVIIGISNYKFNDTLDLAGVYKEKYISKANTLLGSYINSLYFDITTINDYKNIWTALDSEWVDLAFVSSYNLYDKLKEYKEMNGTKTFIDSFLKDYKVLGFRFSSNTGLSYKSGFIVKSNKYDTTFVDRDGNTKIDTLIGKLKNLSTKIYLFRDTLSGSGFQVAKTFLDSIGVDKSRIFRRGMPQYFDIMLADTTGNTVCAFSNDMWAYVKSLPNGDSITNKFTFLEISKDIPTDIVIAKRKNWKDKYSGTDKKINDFLTFRNTDISESRGDILVKSLRYTVQPLDISRKNPRPEECVLKRYWRTYNDSLRFK